MKKQNMKLILSFLFIFIIGTISTFAAPVEFSLDFNKTEKTKLVKMFKYQTNARNHVTVYTTEKDLDILAENKYLDKTRDWSLKLFFYPNSKSLAENLIAANAGYNLKKLNVAGYYPYTIL